MLYQHNASKRQLGLSIPHRIITTAKLLGEHELLTTSLQERTLPMWPDMGSVFFCRRGPWGRHGRISSITAGL